MEFICMELRYGILVWKVWKLSQALLVYGLLEKPNFNYESVVGWFLWALVVLVGLSQVWKLFSLVCFGFWLEISGEKRQTYHFCRNHN